jgi:DNA-binding Lrp family transcriptional regulator
VSSRRRQGSRSNESGAATKTARFVDEVWQAGFTAVPNAILRNPALSYGAKLAFAGLASYAWTNEAAWPGQARLSRELGLSVRTLRDCVRELEEAELLETERRGLGRTNIYRLRVPPRAAAGAAQDQREPPTKKTKSEERQVEEEDLSSPTCNEVENVWSHYRRTFNLKRSALRTTERETIEAALAVANEEECCLAIDALAGSEWHRQRGVTGLVTVFRKQGESIRSRIDYWLDLAARQGAEAARPEDEDDLDVDDVRREQGLEP